MRARRRQFTERLSLTNVLAFVAGQWQMADVEVEVDVAFRPGEARGPGVGPGSPDDVEYCGLRRILSVTTEFDTIDGNASELAAWNWRESLLANSISSELDEQEWLPALVSRRREAWMDTLAGV